ncbi:OsmC family protein-like protein [Karstenula rhodostoma CBS 690.94]|uniref:OsmC family protein-like protein n=1 Tax=Karstenula rhodostoma CBS 690.94 TaxID=1392251 RepID=A0A9P4U6H1_9PLEO|nr:OsmC family protein-like protein [Karstenula rhodostoma CBS 690.94]
MSSMVVSAIPSSMGSCMTTYRNGPSALVTLKSTGSLNASLMTCKLSTSAAVKEATRTAGLHARAGGDDHSLSGELCSGDMLLDALVACAGVSLKAVATALGIPIASGTVTGEGDLDFRGTLGVDRMAPVGITGITGIRMGFEVVFGERESGPVTEGALGKLTERYCVVLQTPVKKPEISVKVVGRDSGGSRGMRW